MASGPPVRVWMVAGALVGLTGLASGIMLSGFDFLFEEDSLEIVGGDQQRHQSVQSQGHHQHPAAEPDQADQHALDSKGTSADAHATQDHDAPNAEADPDREARPEEPDVQPTEADTEGSLATRQAFESDEQRDRWLERANLKLKADQSRIEAACQKIYAAAGSYPPNAAGGDWANFAELLEAAKEASDQTWDVAPDWRPGASGASLTRDQIDRLQALYDPVVSMMARIDATQPYFPKSFRDSNFASMGMVYLVRVNVNRWEVQTLRDGEVPSSMPQDYALLQKLMLAFDCEWFLELRMWRSIALQMVHRETLELVARHQPAIELREQLAAVLDTPEMHAALGASTQVTPPQIAFMAQDFMAMVGDWSIEAEDLPNDPKQFMETFTHLRSGLQLMISFLENLGQRADASKSYQLFKKEDAATIDALMAYMKDRSDDFDLYGMLTTSLRNAAAQGLTVSSQVSALAWWLKAGEEAAAGAELTQSIGGVELITKIERDDSGLVARLIPPAHMRDDEAWEHFASLTFPLYPDAQEE